MSKLIWDKKTQKYVDLSDSKNLKFAKKVYKLSTNKPDNIVSRGESFEVSILTENVDEGTEIPYSILISGNNDSAISHPLKGKFRISSIDSNFNGSDVLTFKVSDDNSSRRKNIMILSLDESSDSLEIILDLSKDIRRVEVSEEVLPEEPAVEEVSEEVLPEEPAVEEVSEEVLSEEPADFKEYDLIDNKKIDHWEINKSSKKNKLNKKNKK